VIVRPFRQDHVTRIQQLHFDPLVGWEFEINHSIA